MGMSNLMYKWIIATFPEWHKLLTLIVFVLAILGMVATDYVKFLPPIHIIAAAPLSFWY
ncbi:hypothetical protein LNO89_08085 [Klebsiella pneumoniae subsp. pneumoniae]|nr:hypothetical protein [Klebsiella pneumoniae subsp. pneumoniae]